MVKANKNRNKMVPQVMPTISVAPSINNDAKNANDAAKAHNNQPGAAKSNKKGSSKRKGKRRSKKHNANANAKDDKKLNFLLLPINLKLLWIKLMIMNDLLVI